MSLFRIWSYTPGLQNADQSAGPIFTESNITVKIDTLTPEEVLGALIRVNYVRYITTLDTLVIKIINDNLIEVYLRRPFQSYCNLVKI